eukprot:1548620-Rhodomonas_salina.1
MWMNVLELAREGVEFTREKVGALLGRRKSSYERVDGVDWGAAAPSQPGSRTERHGRGHRRSRARARSSYGALT